MNMYTKEIAKFLKISDAEALKVQKHMEMSDFDFSESTTAQFKKAAIEAWKEVHKS